MTQIAIDRIRRPAKTRPMNDATVKSLMESFQSAGQICPIIVKQDAIMREMLEDGYLLVSGNHRLTAAINLGWETINAEIYEKDHNAVHLELIEVDENLCRAELTAAEKAAALKKRKILWESLREQKESGGTLGSTRIIGYKQPPESEKGFAASTAEVTGMSKKTINEYIRIADQLGDLLDDIQGTELDSKPKLQELVKLGQEARMAIIQTTVPKMAESVMSKPKRSTSPPDPEKMVEKFVKQFNRLPHETQLLVWESIKVMFEDDD